MRHSSIVRRGGVPVEDIEMMVCVAAHGAHKAFLCRSQNVRMYLSSSEVYACTPLPCNVVSIF
jgi:hypothetical protein